MFYSLYSYIDTYRGVNSYSWVVAVVGSNPDLNLAVIGHYVERARLVTVAIGNQGWWFASLASDDLFLVPGEGIDDMYLCKVANPFFQNGGHMDNKMGDNI